MSFQERFHHAGALLQRMAQVPSPTVASPHDVAQGNGLSRSFSTDGPAEKAVVMQDADFRHVSWIIANDDRLPHIGRQREIEVPQALEMNAIRAYFATLGHGQQQQIELVEAFRQSGEKTTAFPSGLRRLPRFTVRMLMILVENEVLKPGFTG